MSERSVLVIAATGEQSEALIRALADRGHRVRAMARNPSRLEALRGLGAEVVSGSPDDPEAIRAAAAGMDALFAETAPSDRALTEVASAGVRHLVLASLGEVQSLPFTVVRPAHFFENVLSPWNLADLSQGWLRQPMPPSAHLQQLGMGDFARFVTKVIEGKERFFGQRIDLAADDLTGPEMAAVLSKAMGRPIEYLEHHSDEALSDTTIDLAGLEREHPDIAWTNFEDWACEQDWDRLFSAAA